VLGERILGILEDCWQRRDADGVIAESDEETGFSFNMDSISKVTASQRYVKDLAMRDRQEEGAVVLTIQEYEGSGGMHISLRLVVDQEGDKDESIMDAEEIVSRFELLRDCWVQLTDGLEGDELVEEVQELGEEVEELGEKVQELVEEVQELSEEVEELGEKVQENGEELGEEVKEMAEKAKKMEKGEE
jgi:gas vesicle protein